MKFIAWSLAAALLVPHAAVAEGVLSGDAKVRIFTFRQPAKKLDVTKAKPMPLPNLDDARAAKAATTSPRPAAACSVASNYGRTGVPNTMARTPGATLAPYRQAGLLLFTDASGNLLTCSAALVKPGVLVTAARCIAPYGSTTSYQNLTYLPAYDTQASSYGFWPAANANVLASWSAGTGSCVLNGKICPDDIGVVTLTPQNGAYVGAQTGYFAYSTSNYSYSGSNAEITQLGYSAGYSNGIVMLRVDSVGTVISKCNLTNTVIGSPLGDGSNGGPFVVNLGAAPALSSDWSYGTDPDHNIMVGVTSWSSGTAASRKLAGAFLFTPGNIDTLVNTACSTTPGAC